MAPVLSQSGIEGLRNYKYKPAGYTILDDLHQPVWNCTCTRRSFAGSFLRVGNSSDMHRWANISERSAS